MQVSIFRPFKVLNKVVTNWYIFNYFINYTDGEFYEDEKEGKRTIVKDP